MLSYSESTGSTKFSFLSQASKLIVLSSINHEERSLALLQELHDYLLMQKIKTPIDFHFVRLAIEAHPWLIRDVEEKNWIEGERILNSIEANGVKVVYKKHDIRYPEKAVGSFRLILDRITRNRQDSEFILFDYSVLPRTLLLPAAAYIYDAATSNQGIRKHIRFSYAWAQSYFAQTVSPAKFSLVSESDSLELFDYINSSENVYIFLIANGFGQDTAEALSLFNEAVKTAPLVIDDFVFLFHKTAPHDFIKKARANSHIFRDRRDGDIRYIFSSLQVGSFLADRATDLCFRSPRINNLTLLFVPLGPKPCQFATYFGMREMEKKLLGNGCRVNSANIFFNGNEELKHLHSRGIDYCSIMHLRET